MTKEEKHHLALLAASEGMSSSGKAKAILTNTLQKHSVQRLTHRIASKMITHWAENPFITFDTLVEGMQQQLKKRKVILSHIAMVKAEMIRLKEEKQKEKENE